MALTTLLEVWDNIKHMVNSQDSRLKSGLKLPSKVGDPVIVVNHLTKDYESGAGKVRALDSISIGIARRHFTAIMGPSGSGKSTFMHCLAGFESATSGSIKIDDTEIVGMNQRRLTRLRRDHIGFIFQAFNLIPTLSAKENIVLPFEISRRKFPSERFEQVVAALGLQDRLNHRPSELSGGQQQRVACARALLQDAVVLFADEPTGNLDSESSEQVLRYLRKAVNDFGQSVVMVTHEAAAAAYADRVLFLSDGKIVAELDNPERERILAAQTKLPAFMAAHSLPNTANGASQSLKDSPQSASFLPAGTKSGAWPDHEKMQARLANLQLARGAQVELPPSPAASNKVGGIDAGALHALMGAGKPVVPAELRTREGARRALAKKRETAPEKKNNPPVEVASPRSTAKQAEPAASKMPVTRLSGSVRETRDERGTTWQGWTPKPGSKATKEEKPRQHSSSKTVPKPEPARSPRPHTPAKPPASTPGGFKASKAAASAPRKTDQKTDNQRWSGLYSVFSNPVAETSGFWEDAEDASASRKTSSTENSEPTAINDSRANEAATKKTPGKQTGGAAQPKVTASKAGSKKSAGNQMPPIEAKPSKSVPRTPEDTLNQEKQRLLAMIKKAEALLDSSQDAIDSFETPQDKA
ncbi:ATP-binding cassette domain-containing protein [uncultured Varibaculum sp.]|uniref:ATP-binding cassette domain-containing protein n=1 Tax=uncultured Varibaculum sp. TaxID=413896 RepID=UPI0027D9B25D|nr:ATP-binding cassette domain-containing protein [uncultured Varibaculum sp.]